MGFIYTISQRSADSTGGCRWGPSSEYNDAGRQNILKEKAKLKRWSGRYTAVNLENRSTYEVRIFKGTLKPESFHKNLEFVKSAYDYTLYESYRNVSVDGYLRYITDSRRKNQSYNLINFLKKKGVI